MFTEDKLLQGLYSVRKHLEAGQLPSVQLELNKLIQATELAIVTDCSGKTTSPSTILTHWLKRNAYIDGYKSKRGTCLTSNKSKSHIYVYEDFAIYRETSSRGYTETVSNQTDALALQIDTADKLNDTTLDLPTAAEVAAFIRIEKAKHSGKTSRVLWNFGEGKPTVRADLLLDMLSLFPDINKARIRNELSPIYFYSYGQDGILFPARDYT